MSNVSINSDSHYKNIMYMDCYNGNDVGGTTAFALDRMEAKGFILQADKNRSTWNDAAELITTKNISSQSVNYAASAGNSSKLGGYSVSTGTSGNTVVLRNGSGYIYATYYNGSAGTENINSYTSYPAFFDSNGWLRKCNTSANFRSWVGLGNVNNTADSNKSVKYATSAGNASGLNGTAYTTVNGYWITTTAAGGQAYFGIANDAKSDYSNSGRHYE